jgi:hypothetical protein
MKNPFFLVLISLLLLANGLYMLFSATVVHTASDTVQAVLLIFISGFALFRGLADTYSIWKGDPVKDEFTQKIRIKAASTAYRISIWTWLGLMIVSRSIHWLASEIVMTGVLIMGGIYIIAFTVMKIRGLGNE